MLYFKYTDLLTSKYFFTILVDEHCLQDFNIKKFAVHVGGYVRRAHNNFYGQHLVSSPMIGKCSKVKKLEEESI